jgi:hypothetical protein
MRLFAFALAGMLLAGSAFAAEPVTTKETTYTNEEISKALEFLGRPPLHSSRTLHDDGQKIDRSEINSVSKITFERR